MATVSSLMTTEELLALPDDGIDRWLIAGELRERPMTLKESFPQPRDDTSRQVSR